jgi:radical SAM protein with 4Fe4S-binding SPASM domain
MHPKEAVLLALFDGDRTVEEARGLWTVVAGKPPEDAVTEFDRFLGFYATGEPAERGFLIEVDEKNRGTVRQYDPMDFVIPAREVDTKDPRFRKPYTVFLMPTLFCPQKCVYCYARTSPRPESDPVPLGRLEEIFAELREIGVDVIQMTGGDPFARKDIFEILELVFNAGMVPDVPTKLGLTYPEALRLKDMGVKLVQVSLDTADPAILDHMVGVKGYHNRVFTVFENLRRAGLSVRVNSVLTPLNVGTAGDLIDYLGGLGNVVKLALTPYGRSLFCHSDALFLDEPDHALVERQWKERKDLYPHMRITFGGGVSEVETPELRGKRWRERAMCTANRHGFIILPDGRVTVCEELYDHPSFIIGDLRQQSVMEMWRSPEALALVHPDQSEVQDGPCRHCGAFAECNEGRGRCWRDVLKAYGWNRPYYPDPKCPLAPSGNRLT